MSKTIIMIAGYVAGGKTTFSHKLSKELNIPVFNKDLIKSVLGNYITINNRDDSKNLSKATFGVMKHLAENLMKTEFSFILESNFNITETEILKGLIAKYGYKSLSFVFVGDMKVIHKRFVERDASPEREAANRMYGLLDDFDVFENSIRHLGDFNIGDKVLRIDTTSFDDVDFGYYIQEASDFVQ